MIAKRQNTPGARLDFLFNLTMEEGITTATTKITLDFPLYYSS